MKPAKQNSSDPAEPAIGAAIVPRYGLRPTPGQMHPLGEETIRELSGALKNNMS